MGCLHGSLQNKRSLSFSQTEYVFDINSYVYRTTRHLPYRLMCFVLLRRVVALFRPLAVSEAMVPEQELCHKAGGGKLGNPKRTFDSVIHNGKIWHNPSNNQVPKTYKYSNLLVG